MSIKRKERCNGLKRELGSEVERRVVEEGQRNRRGAGVGGREGLLSDPISKLSILVCGNA